MRFYNRFILFIFFIIPYYIFAENVPAVGSGDSIVQAGDITIGHSVETLLTTTVLSKLSEAIPTSNWIPVVIIIFTALFFMDYIYSIASCYIQSDYSAIVPTTVIKGFFFIAVTTALSASPSGSPYVFAIIKDIASYSVHIIGSPMSWAWFDPQHANDAIVQVNQNGVLSSLDKMVTTVSNSMLDNPEFWTSFVWIVWVVFMVIMFRFVYFEVLKLVLGLAVKTFEWAIGLPIAFIMLAGKGHPQGDEYFNIGMQYIYYVALDLCILVGMFQFGSDLITTLSDSLATSATFGATMFGLLQLIVAITFWLGAVLNVESIVSGIAGGAPAFANNMGSSLLAIGKGIVGSTSTAVAPITALKAGITNRLNGGTFLGGIGTHIKNTTIGQSKTDKDGNKTWDTTGSIIGDAKSQFTSNLKKGFETSEVTIEKTDPITGIKHQVKQKHTGVASSELGQHVGQIAGKITAIKDRSNEYKKFEEEHGISKKQMMEKGLTTEKSRNLYMKNIESFKDIDEKISSYGASASKIHKKTGKAQVRNINDVKEELRELEGKANNEFNSAAQKNFSKQSGMTKEMKKTLNTHSNNTDSQIKILQSWLNEGTKNMKEFSVHDFRNAVKDVSNNLIKNKDVKGLNKLQKSLDAQTQNYSHKADGNELFKHIENNEQRENSNKSFKIHLNYINNSIKNLTIK